MGKAVVVVEDDPLIRSSLKACFESAGYTVVTGETVEMVAAMLSMRQYVSHVQLAAVVADFHLDRGISGITAIRCMEKMHGKEFRPVLITADDSLDVVAKAKSAGVDLLRKPFHFGDLLATVER